MRTRVHWYPVMVIKNNKLAQKMDYSLKKRTKYLLTVRLQLLVMISWLLLAVNGQLIDSGWGWVSCPPQVAGLAEARRQSRPGQRSNQPGCGCRPAGVGSWPACGWPAVGNCQAGGWGCPGWCGCGNRVVGGGPGLGVSRNGDWGTGSYGRASDWCCSGRC